MTYEREDELVKKLENENYKGTKSLVKELENKFGEMHYQNIDSKQRYINSIYDSLSSSGEAKLNKVIELYNKDHPIDKLESMQERMREQEDIVDRITVLFLEYGDMYSKENINVDNFIYTELKDSLKNIKYDEIQDVIDEASKKIRTQMKEQDVDEGKQKSCIDAFAMNVKQYGEDNIVRLRITNFEISDAQAEKLMALLNPDKEKFEKMSEQEQKIEKIKMANNFKFEFREAQRKMAPEDFQSVIKKLDKSLNWEERKVLDSAVKLNNRENDNKYETRRIKLSESEKDKSWQKIEAESVRAKRLRDFKIELAELKKNKERSKDKYDTGFVNFALRTAINLQNYIQKIANYISANILYKNPEFKNGSRTDDITRQAIKEPTQEQKNQASPFYALMKEAYKEKGNELVILLSKNNITKAQAEQMFVKDMAYISTLNKDQQDEIMQNYTNSIAKGMLQPITSIDAKNIVRELIANYESGKYDSLIEKTAKEKDFDWSSIYKEERRKSKTENEPQKKQEEKADASKGFKPHLTENDKTALEIGNLTRQAWTIGVKTAKDGNNIESFQASISEFAHNHQDMNKEKLSEYVTMSAAVALNYPHDNNFKENIQNYTNQYQQKHGKLSINTEKERIMALLEGASRIDTADRINFVVNKKQNAPNVFQEETHNAMEAALKNIKGDDKQKFVTELAEKTFYTKQQYFLAIEAHKLNLNVKTDKETKDKKQIDKKISSISAAYEKRATFNNDRLNTEQILVAACERASGSISAQYIYDNVAKSLTGNKKAIEQLCADAQSYNKFKEQHIINTEKKKEPILKEGKFTSMANDTNASGLHHSKKIEEIAKNLTVNKEATDNIIDINVGIEEQAKIFADRFNNLEKEAGPDLIEWGKTHHSEEKESLISQIDERINNKNAAENFTDIVSDNFPFCETPKSLELKFQEPEEVTEIPFEEVDINDFGFEDR